jgi:DNA polymerase III epsilon subunit-like protein
MSVIIFDVETTGLPKKRNIPFTDFDNWPHIVQLSWIVYKDRYIESINDHIIKIDNDIPEDSIKIHGITNEMMRTGENIVDVLMKFKQDLSHSKMIVAHNIEFDTSIISVELLRNNLRNVMYFYRGVKYCTMHKTRKMFKRWPKLSKLHEKLFDKTPENLHNSLIDVYVCFRCFCKYEYGYDPVYEVVNGDDKNIIKFRNMFIKNILN